MGNIKQTIWENVVNLGLDLDMLEQVGYKQMLLNGEKTPPVKMKIKVGSMIIDTYSCLQLTNNSNNELIIALSEHENKKDHE